MKTTVCVCVCVFVVINQLVLCVENNKKIKVEKKHPEISEKMPLTMMMMMTTYTHTHKHRADGSTTNEPKHERKEPVKNYD